MRRKSLYIFLAISVTLGLTIYLVDIIGTYFESLLNDNEFPIYIKLSSEMNEPQQIHWGLMCRLPKNIYNVKQWERLWNQNIIAFFISLELIQINEDLSIFIRSTLDKEIKMVSVYVDNFLLASNHLITLNILKEAFGKKYSIKDLREIQTIIEWQISQDLASCTLEIDQEIFVIQW